MELGGGVLGLVGLITWVITALGGFYMLGRWLGAGGMRADGGQPTRLPRPVLFTHFLLAAVGLVIWIIYLLTDADVLAWISFAVLVVVAVLGFTMFARWLGGRRTAAGSEPTAESRFPLAAVLGHGLFGAATIVLVILVALEVGGS